MLAISLASTLASMAQAQTPAAAAPAAEAKPDFNLCKQIGDRFKIFNAKRDGAENPYIQEFNVTLRAQYQLNYLDPTGDHTKSSKNGESQRWNDEMRRFRLGANAKLFNKVKAVMIWNLGGMPQRKKTSSSTGNWERAYTNANLDQVFLQVDAGSPVGTSGKQKPAYRGGHGWLA